MSEIAFHEKTGRSQVGSFFILLDKGFSPAESATVAMLPSALSRSDSFRFVHVGRSRRSEACLVVSFFILLDKGFSPAESATVAMLPSALSRSDSFRFHEKAGRSQVSSFFILSFFILLDKGFSPAESATVAMLPSALSRSDSFRSVHVGRSRYSRCCHLFSALWFCSCRVEPGPGD